MKPRHPYFLTSILVNCPWGSLRRFGVEGGVKNGDELYVKKKKWKRELGADSLGKKWKDPTKMSLSEPIGKKRNREGSKNREHDIMAAFHQLLLQK